MLLCLFGYASKYLYIFNLYMTPLAERDKHINCLEQQIKLHKNFLGGRVIKLSETNANKLRTLKRYLKHNGYSGEKDLETINALLMQN